MSEHSRSRRHRTRKSLPAVEPLRSTRSNQLRVDLPGFYAPGRLRAESDREHLELCAFVERHPEYAPLPEDVLAQYLDRGSGFRSDDEMLERERLAAEGVPLTWERDEAFSDMRTSDDL